MQRARQLFDKERQHPTPVETIARHWGYKSLNGPGAVTLAALKKFELASTEGSGEGRRARLTDLAIDILENPSPAARRTATQRAALNPTIHRELWEKYGSSLPSDLNLRWELTRDRGFTETGAAEFIPEYKETVAFAQLGQPDSTVGAQKPDGSPDETPGEDEAPRDDEPSASERRRRLYVSERSSIYAIPLPGGTRSLQLEGEFPLSEADWQQFIAVLSAMKPGLVDEEGAQNG